MCVYSRLEKANAQIITRSRSGVPQSATAGNRGTASVTAGADQLVSGKQTPEEIKEKMEQQLRMQRAAHQQKRALETLKSPAVANSSANQLVKVTTNSNQGERPLLYSLNPNLLHGFPDWFFTQFFIKKKNSLNTINSLKH